MYLISPYRAARPPKPFALSPTLQRLPFNALRTSLVRTDPKRAGAAIEQFWRNVAGQKLPTYAPQSMLFQHNKLDPWAEAAAGGHMSMGNKPYWSDLQTAVPAMNLARERSIYPMPAFQPKHAVAAQMGLISPHMPVFVRGAPTVVRTWPNQPMARAWPPQGREIRRAQDARRMVNAAHRQNFLARRQVGLWESSREIQKYVAGPYAVSPSQFGR